MGRLQHVTVTVGSEELLPAVEAFYLALGGVSQVRPPKLAADTLGRWIGFDDSQVHLILGEPVAEPAHFALELGDEFDSVRASLADLEVAVREARDLWGSRRCFVHDPAGNLVELFETGPA